MSAFDGNPRVASLRHRVTIEEPQRTGDEGGGAEINWVAVTSVWAEVRPKTGREIFESDQLGARVTHDVRMRYRAGVTPRMRIFHRGRYFNIRYVVDLDERGAWLMCGCEEVMPR